MAAGGTAGAAHQANGLAFGHGLTHSNQQLGSMGVQGYGAIVMGYFYVFAITAIPTLRVSSDNSPRGGGIKRGITPFLAANINRIVSVEAKSSAAAAGLAVITGNIGQTLRRRCFYGSYLGRKRNMLPAGNNQGITRTYAAAIRKSVKRDNSIRIGFIF